MKHILVLVLIGLVVLVLMGGQVVMGHTYALRSGQALAGDLSIGGGSSTLEQGSRVTGSLRVTGGSLVADGQIDGDVLVTGGSVAFGPSAVVRGAVRMTGGGIRVAEGASVPPIESFVVKPPAPVQAFLDSEPWHAAWPAFILALGLICFAAMRLGGTGVSWLAIPGAILSTLGLLFLFQKTFDQYQTWAYAWALVLPTSVGIGKYIQGAWSNQPSLRDQGMRVARVGLILFAIMAIFFEFAINLSGLVGSDMARFVLPALLILVGALLLLSRRLSPSESSL